MNVPRLSISVLAGFILVALCGMVLHAFGQNSKAWWIALLPLWAAVALMLYKQLPRNWPPEPPRRR